MFEAADPIVIDSPIGIARKSACRHQGITSSVKGKAVADNRRDEIEPAHGIVAPEFGPVQDGDGPHAGGVVRGQEDHVITDRRGIAFCACVEELVAGDAPEGLAGRFVDHGEDGSASSLVIFFNAFNEQPIPRNRQVAGKVAGSQRNRLDQLKRRPNRAGIRVEIGPARGVTERVTLGAHGDVRGHNHHRHKKEVSERRFHRSLLVDE